MMDALTWLNSQMGIKRNNQMPHLPDSPTILQFLAELVYINQGSLIVKNFGQIQNAIGAYGRIGLTLQEAFFLTELASNLNGLLLATDNDVMRQAVHTMIQEEIHRVEKEFLEWNSKHLVLPGEEDVKRVNESRILLP